jgi:hypothetical protein
MLAEEIRFLFAYDRWATLRVLSVLDDVDPVVWTRTDVVGDRGLGEILVHHLGASQSWRIGSETQAPTKDPSRNSSRCRRSTSFANVGRRSGSRSMRGCRP